MTDNYSPKFQEEYSAKLPALALLAKLGWQFINPDQALTARSGKLDQVVLHDELRSQLQKRRYPCIFHIERGQRPTSATSSGLCHLQGLFRPTRMS